MSKVWKCPLCGAVLEDHPTGGLVCPDCDEQYCISTFRDGHGELLQEYYYQQMNQMEDDD